MGSTIRADYCCTVDDEDLTQMGSSAPAAKREMLLHFASVELMSRLQFSHILPRVWLKPLR